MQDSDFDSDVESGVGSDSNSEFDSDFVKTRCMQDVSRIYAGFNRQQTAERYIHLR